ncbi:MAG: hypothetical protein KKH02_01420 [Proteobacteria bacterium]|nr:hypothetical protein [Pseudomonadota bacterium]
MANMTITEEGNKIADDFVSVAALASLDIPRSDIEVTVLVKPHRPPSFLPSGKLGVYAFMFGDRCLKVGKAGPNSVARFCGQHYGTNAPSTLAKSLLKSQSSIGMTSLDSSNIKTWICENTTRFNFLLPSRHGVFALSLLEAFVQCRLRPEFEGFASQRWPSNPAVEEGRAQEQRAPLTVNVKPQNNIDIRHTLS